MNADIFTALELLEKEGVPQAYMIEKIEQALASAFKKEYGATALMRVDIDISKKKIKAYLQKEVVEVVEDPVCQISLEEARATSKRAAVGQLLEKEVKTDAFRRTSAAAAKSVIIQGIREAKRQAMQEAYENKKEELITATAKTATLCSSSTRAPTGFPSPNRFPVKPSPWARRSRSSSPRSTARRAAP